MKGIKITVMMLIICQAVIAQTKTAKEVTTKRMERLDSKVDLTDDQESKISEIIFASATEMIALKKSGSFEREEMKELKKKERNLIKSQLTSKQLTTLKEANETRHLEHQKRKNDRMIQRNTRTETRDLILAKRHRFENLLSIDEKAIIEKARTLKPERIKGKKTKGALTPEQKTERKEAHIQIRKLLKPVVKNHKKELDIIQSEMPAKEPKSSNEKKKKNNGFYTKFLLMK
ncbi:MAG: hypothetical protein COA58_16425 [Bacteroidetes bacterium]|nr:MAG: hypothetical protein COA58_16425 [Bacteroidota bacterium]